jgi:hypothetical protein
MATTARAAAFSAESVDLALVMGLLHQVLAGQTAILAALERGQKRPPSHLTRADRDRLARMLPAVMGVFGSEERFSSRDLAEDTRPAVRLVVRGLSVKKISKLFGRADGIPINGLMVQKQGEEFQVAVWRVVAC